MFCFDFFCFDVSLIVCFLRMGDRWFFSKCHATHAFSHWKSSGIQLHTQCTSHIPEGERLSLLAPAGNYFSSRCAAPACKRRHGRNSLLKILHLPYRVYWLLSMTVIAFLLELQHSEQMAGSCTRCDVTSQLRRPWIRSTHYWIGGAAAAPARRPRFRPVVCRKDSRNGRRKAVSNFDVTWYEPKQRGIMKSGYSENYFQWNDNKIRVIVVTKWNFFD